MRTLRRTIELKDGVKVETLFTPHLYSFASEKGIAFDADMEQMNALIETYADLYYLAAINAWYLDGKGTAEDFPHTRGDFHEYAAANPRPFARDVEFAIEALTGKTAKELVIERENAGNSAVPEAAKGKKKAFAWIGRLLKRSS